MLDKNKLVIDWQFINDSKMPTRIYKHIIVGFINNTYLHVTCSPLREDEYKGIFKFFQYITKLDYKSKDYFNIILNKKDYILDQLTLDNYKRYLIFDRFDL